MTETGVIVLDSEYGAANYSRANLHSNMGNEDRATEDIEMVTHLTNVNIEAFANENNIWRSQHLKLEETGDLRMSWIGRTVYAF